jgi:hypothetical protein
MIVKEGKKMPNKVNSFQCKVCFGRFHGYGNNGQPLVNGRVCDFCDTFVIAHRINLVLGGRK